MGYGSATKRNEPLTPATMRMRHEDTTLGERRQTWKTTLVDSKSPEAESRSEVACGWGRDGSGRDWAVVVKGYGVSFEGDKNVLKLWGWLHNSDNLLKATEW